MRTSKFLLLLVFQLALVTVSNAQRENAAPFKKDNFAVSGISAVKVETSGGSITVTGGSSGDITVETYVRLNNSSDAKAYDQKEIEERLKNYEIFVGRENGMVVARAKRKNPSRNNWKDGLSVSFNVIAPRKINTDLQTSGGSVTIATLTGDQRLNTSGGSLKISDVDGPSLRGTTSGGSITVLKSSGKIDLSTSGGSITAADLNGNVRLVTSGGSIKLNNIKGEVSALTSGGSVVGQNIFGKLDSGTSGGSIRLTNVNASLKAHTSGGSVNVEVVKLGDYLDLSTSAGGVTVSMPLDKGMDVALKGNRVSMPLTNFSGKAEKDHIVGKMNGGGAKVTISTSAGNVNVNAR